MKTGAWIVKHKSIEEFEPNGFCINPQTVSFTNKNDAEEFKQKVIEARRLLGIEYIYNAEVKVYEQEI